MRHSHQAKNPENLNPQISATADRRPSDASTPMGANANAIFFPPLSDARMFRATIFPCLTGCCAVGGCGRPLCGFGTSAQSPSAPDARVARDLEKLIDDDLPALVAQARESGEQRTGRSTGTPDQRTRANLLVGRQLDTIRRGRSDPGLQPHVDALLSKPPQCVLGEICTYDLDGVIAEEVLLETERCVDPSEAASQTTMRRASRFMRETAHDISYAMRDHGLRDQPVNL